MAQLLDKLADLSVRVGDLEARAEAFKRSQQKRRDRKVAQMKAEVQARQDKLQALAEANSDEIASAWTELNQSMRLKAERTRKQIEARKGAIDSGRAERRAVRLELNAMLAIDFASLAMGEAELAVAEAVDARIQADILTDAKWS